MEKVEGIIVGQGLAGTLLAHELIVRGRKVMVIDVGEERTSSKVAAGIYNPITGRKMVKTWLADEIFPTLPAYYKQLEELTGEHFLHENPIYRPFHGVEEQNDWQSKLSDEPLSRFVTQLHQSSMGIEGVKDEFGGLLLNYSGYVELPKMLKAMREFFKAKGMLLSQLFHYDKLEDLGTEIRYDGLQADWVVCCEGPRVVDNPFFQMLKFRLVKGELIGIETNATFEHIVNRGVFMIPKDLYIQVGSTYDHRTLDWSPSSHGVHELEERLKKLYVKDYSIVNKKAGVRPATFDRRPYAGMLKKRPRIGIFNGLGTKGVSLGPHFAQLMTKHLVDGTPLPSEISIER